MIDEPSRRRPGFTRGAEVRLADGQAWYFPAGPSSRLGPAALSLLDGVDEAESRAEALRAELAFALFLLTAQYELAPAELDALVSLPPGEVLWSLQEATHAAVVAFAGRPAPAATPVPGPEAVPAAARRWGWFRTS